MMEQWVLISYHDREPCQVYGLFESEREALEWADRQARHTVWEAKQILDVDEEDVEAAEEVLMYSSMSRGDEE